MVRSRSMAMQDSRVTMDKSAVSFYTPESKMQSNQWTKRGKPGPIKAKVHATRSKQMVLAFFDNEGLIYTNYVPKGQTVNANYIVEALSKFLATFKKKRPNIWRPKSGSFTGTIIQSTLPPLSKIGWRPGTSGSSTNHPIRRTSLRQTFSYS
jgi:hypothetical protein